VSDSTKNIFLESAFFNPVTIRKTSFRHHLRTDAAMHFEKSVDIGQTLEVLKKATNLICENAGGKLESDPTDQYPAPKEQPVVTLLYSYLKKMSGKIYEETTVHQILTGLGFIIKNENEESITVQASSHKTDVSIAADLVEEIMRIDGFDNIEIPTMISISPSVSGENKDHQLREKLSGLLVGQGFNEMLNNSITHSANYTDEEMQGAVKMLNNLSAELDTLRLSMLETGLQTVARNLNHRNENLKLFEFGKTYSRSNNKFSEETHLALFTTGNITEVAWNKKSEPANIFYVKGLIQSIQQQSGIKNLVFTETNHPRFEYLIEGKMAEEILIVIGKPSEQTLKKFDIRVPVIYADINWDRWLTAGSKENLRFKEIAKFPAVLRDLSFVIDKKITYREIEKVLTSLSLKNLKSYKLFDIFESEKLGIDKQSIAMNFLFQDESKTLTDEEIDKWMHKIALNFETNLQAELRK
jgi:phenylalanyl-tRNA synthetase beta chain